MKKTREYCSRPASLAIFVCVCITGIATSAAIYTLSFWLANNLDGELPRSELLIGLLVLMFLLLIIMFMLVYRGLIERILGHEVEDSTNCYIDSYAITSAIVLAHQTSSIDFKKALTTVRMYFEYSYAEIDALYKVMRRTGKVYYVLPAHELPEHLGTIQIAISRRTAKRIRNKLSPQQYAILSREFYYNYLGEELLPTRSSYISRRDIRRMLNHPQWVQTGQIQVCSSIGNFATLQADLMDAWSSQLTAENQYLPTNLEYNSTPTP